MAGAATLPVLDEFPVLLRGEAGPLAAWARQAEGRRVALHLAVIVLGAGLYGAAMGCWRGPLQALYVGLKLPLILLLTTVGNALLNSMLAPLLGLNLRFRETLLAILMSFAIASAILGSFSPLLVYVIWNAPELSAARAGSSAVYPVFILLHAVVIGFAGIAANLRLFRLLAGLGGSAATARRVLFAWLAGNLLLGSQLAWILRPFLGSPSLDIEFLRDSAFEGNFFEGLYNSLRAFLSSS